MKSKWWLLDIFKQFYITKKIKTMKKVNEILQELLTKVDADMFYEIQYSKYIILLQGHVEKSTIDKLTELGYDIKFYENDFYFMHQSVIENIKLDITLTIK